MKYITHHRYKELALCKKQLNIPYGTEVICENNILYTIDGKSICIARSENAKLHFARNDDGRGLQRGSLTYAIAYGHRERKCKDGSIRRFSDTEQEILLQYWYQFLQKDTDAIIFNDNFFIADVDELERLATSLNMKSRR